MKHLLSVVVMMVFLASTSFASFPVKKSDSDNKATEVVSEQDAVDNAKESKITKRIQKVAAKVQKKIAAAAEGQGAGDTTAIILALVSVIFLPLGLHNWYLGRKKQALWQTLLVFPFGILIVTALISWIWQIIDLIRLLGDGLP